MASKKNTGKIGVFSSKKTRQGRGKNTKYGAKGGGQGGSTPSKLYRKKYRGRG